MLGCDIIEIERIEQSIEKFGENFLKNILSDNEIALYERRGKKAEFVAGRFAAKEAVSKALGTGIGRGYGFTDIEILPDELGKPFVYLKNEKKENMEVSISHSRMNAIAVCVIKEAE